MITALSDLTIDHIPSYTKFLIDITYYYILFPYYHQNVVYQVGQYITNISFSPNISYQLYILGVLTSVQSDNNGNITLNGVPDLLLLLPSAGGLIINTPFIFTSSYTLDINTCINLNTVTNANTKLIF